MELFFQSDIVLVRFGAFYKLKINAISYNIGASALALCKFHEVDRGGEVRRVIISPKPSSGLEAASTTQLGLFQN